MSPDAFKHLGTILRHATCAMLLVLAVAMLHPSSHGSANRRLLESSDSDVESSDSDEASAACSKCNGTKFIGPSFWQTECTECYGTGLTEDAYRKQEEDAYNQGWAKIDTGNFVSSWENRYFVTCKDRIDGVKYDLRCYKSDNLLENGVAVRYKLKGNPDFDNKYFDMKVTEVYQNRRIEHKVRFSRDEWGYKDGKLFSKKRRRLANTPFMSVMDELLLASPKEKEQ